MYKKPYNPSLTKTETLRRLSTYRRISHNRFRWWRWFDKNNPLPGKKPVLQRIENGEYDNYVYYLQSILCEHMLNQIWEDSKGDTMKYNENSANLQLRRQRLLEDYWKFEDKALEQIPKHIAKELKVLPELVEEFMEKFDGTTLELYNEIKINPLPFKASLIKYLNGL